MAFAFASIAVAWHRRIVLDEHPKFSGSNLATKSLWRYVGIGIVIALTFIVSFLVINFLLLRFLRIVGGLLSPSTFIFSLLSFESLLYLALTLVMLRLILLLPARAVGDLGLTFRQTWTRTRRNTWRMFWGVAACMLPPGLLAQMIWLFFPAPSDISLIGSEAFAVRLAVVTTIAIVYALLTVPIVVGFLSLSYRHFFQRT